MDVPAGFHNRQYDRSCAFHILGYRTGLVQRAVCNDHNRRTSPRHRSSSALYQKKKHHREATNNSGRHYPRNWAGSGHPSRHQQIRDHHRSSVVEKPPPTKRNSTEFLDEHSCRGYSIRVGVPEGGNHHNHNIASRRCSCICRWAPHDCRLVKSCRKNQLRLVLSSHGLAVGNRRVRVKRELI